MKSSTKKSPVRRANRRLPGQSLDDLINRTRDNVFAELMPVFLLCAVAIMEWLRVLTDASSNPWHVTLLAMAAIGWSIYRLRASQQLITRYRLGREGERSVAQTLEALKPEGYFVLNDIRVGESERGWNIDHLLVGPAGIFTIETKTLMKPRDGRNKIVYQAPRLFTGNLDLSQHLVQSASQATRVRGMLDEYGLTPGNVRSVLLFPGWFIEYQTGRERSIWVLEPKAFIKWVRNAPVVLSAQDCQALLQFFDGHQQATTCDSCGLAQAS